MAFNKLLGFLITRVSSDGGVMMGDLKECTEETEQNDTEETEQSDTAEAKRKKVKLKAKRCRCT